MQEVYSTKASHSVSQVESSKVLRNTYMLLGMTLAFSAVTAAISMAAGLGHGAGLIMSLVAMGLIWFVLPRTANSSTGLLVVFAFTGLIGAGLGPILNKYLSMTNGSTIIMQALGGTAVVFVSLSAYVLTTRKNFNFLGGFVAVGMILMLVIMLFLIGASFFGYQFSGLHLAFSAGIVLLMSALILYQTSEIIHGGESNYILATTSLYLSIINLFTSLLHLLGISSDE
ncbi:Bax inhibitor-1/YccA family protein [Cellvibrio sp. KY-YJ-3]|jgi:modulator of FtsH protease|uniref:Bax inhibitor-1/YccA family protein n=1 Tax=Cellvibrio sp. KY-YJ-3 TaxID=454662 RepID=UPI0012444810|nr:Bax inhibitor-1/YccA family protein [Cellvibrio sp. KY-YJ-3]QEY12958.1 BAX inhibitor (BI)-1/YccA family protein [Cellvibrio sp. KY-YJ-3]